MHLNNKNYIYLMASIAAFARPARVGMAARRRASPITRAGTPATTAQAGTSRVTTEPAPITAPSPIVVPDKMVAFDPIEAWRQTRLVSTFQSAASCNFPPIVALGYLSLVKTTPCPTNTSSSIVTPSQMKLWDEILQRDPILAPTWISTNVPFRDSSTTVQP